MMSQHKSLTGFLNRAMPDGLPGTINTTLI